jgi:peptide/nickel transport system substrate-binding protein
MLNEELNVAFPTWLKNDDGSLVEITAPDEYTVVFKYKNPITTVPNEIANFDNKDAQTSMFLPSAYLKQFHAKYTDEAKLNEMAKAASFESWKQLFQNKELPFRNPDRPVMAPWMSVNTINDPIYHLVRNPYYVAVDTAGQQLPYIDELNLVTYQDQKALNMAAIQGQLDSQDRHIVMSNYPTLVKQSEALGTYDVRLWTTFAGCDAVVAINTYCQDLNLREVLSDQQFRYALSIAIDRDEIIESAFLGIGEARQAVPRSTHPYYPGDEYAFYGTQFDQQEANKILDDLGYVNKDSEGFRLMKNGERISIEISWTPQFANWGDIAAMVVEDWLGIGIQGIAVERERTNMYTMADANELVAYIWNEDTAGFPFTGQPKFDPRNAWNTGDSFAIPVRDWVATNGEKGEPPTADFARIMEIVDQAKVSGEEEKVKLSHELFQIWAKGLYEIGIAGLTPMIQGVAVENINLRNVPGDDELGNDWPLRTPGNARTEQFFFAQ